MTQQAPPSLTEVEPYGVDRIPDADRTAMPLDLFRVAFGGANTFSTCVLGAFPILFGLSFWQGLAATLLGLVAGALILCPMTVFGPVNGTNNAVASSAHLGVHGRIVGAFLSLLALFLEPRAAYGPQDARLVRTVDTPAPPITGPGTDAPAAGLAPTEA